MHGQTQLDLSVDGITGPEVLSSLGVYAKVTTGMDVSDYQKGIVWSSVAGIDFVYAKASEGATWKSQEFASHCSGAYHFARMGANTPWAEFDNFMSVVGHWNLDLPVALGQLAYLAIHEQGYSAGRLG